MIDFVLSLVLLTIPKWKSLGGFNVLFVFTVFLIMICVLLIARLRRDDDFRRTYDNFGLAKNSVKAIWLFLVSVQVIEALWATWLLLAPFFFLYDFQIFSDPLPIVFLGSEKLSMNFLSLYFLMVIRLLLLVRFLSRGSVAGYFLMVIAVLTIPVFRDGLFVAKFNINFFQMKSWDFVARWAADAGFGINVYYLLTLCCLVVYHRFLQRNDLIQDSQSNLP